MQVHKKEHNIWATPIWEVFTDVDVPVIREIIMKSQELTELVDMDILDFPIPQIQDFREEIRTHMLNALTQHFPNFNVEVFFRRSWINIQKPGEDHLTHSHNGAEMVAVFYLQAAENSGDLVLIDPRAGSNWGWDLEDGHVGAKSKLFPPVEGKLIFQPAYVVHHVKTNMSDLDRLALTMEISLSVIRK